MLPEKGIRSRGMITWSLRTSRLVALENDSSPIPFLHPGDVSAAEPYAVEHIDLEDVAPILVGNCIKRFGLKNPGLL